MNTIYKYPLFVQEAQTIKLPIFSNILCVQVQHHKLYLWAEVFSKETEKEDVQIKIVGTGKPMNMDNKPEALHSYLGTVQMQDGDLILHVYVLRVKGTTID